MQQQKRYFVDCKLLISDKLIIIIIKLVSINQNLYKSGMTVQLTYRIQFENFRSRSDLITGFLAVVGRKIK